MEQIVALDIGERRIGIAMADTLGLAVRPYKTVLKDQILAELETLSSDYELKCLVIGLPLHRDGKKSEQTLKVEEFSQQIQENFPALEICFENEILTSNAAKERLSDLGIRVTEKNKGLIDTYAAVIILEQYFFNRGL